MGEISETNLRSVDIYLLVLRNFCYTNIDSLSLTSNLIYIATYIRE